MGKLRTRVKGGKGKRWAKGHSSSSNPEIKRHRQAAKSGFFGQPTNDKSTKNSALTEDALKVHTAATTKFPVPKQSAPSESFTAAPSIIDGNFDDETLSLHSSQTFKSFKTFATEFSNCTNMSFNRLFKGFTPSSGLHKEMLAVLAAVTEVIKQQGGKESETEYFAALMTTLEVAEISEDSLAATLSLLGMVIKRVPQNVLKVKFSTGSKILLDLLSKHVETENTVIVRSLIGCLSVFLRAQDAVVWSNSSTVQLYDALLTFATHTKPPVRKAAQHAICAILRGSSLLTEGPDPPVFHPVAAHTGKYCAMFIEQHGFGNEVSSLLHILNLLKEILSVLPQSETKTLCEAFLKLMTLNNALVTSCAMQALHGMLSVRPKLETLSAELNARLITALYDYQPSLNDTQPVMAWISVMTQAHLNLGNLDLALCAAHLPRFFSTATQLWQSDRSEVAASVSPALSSLLTQCLDPALKSLHTSENSPIIDHVRKIVACVEQSLGFSYVRAWRFVIHLCTTLFEAVGKYETSVLAALLKSLADLRVSPRFPYEPEVDYAIGKAVRVMGPQFVLNCIPLNITGREETYDFPRSWLLPILRENLSHTELAFFVEYFLPLAQSCHSRSLKCRAAKDLIGERTFDLLQRQIWGLLPGFCKHPTDIEKTFKALAKTLGMVISERTDIRMDVMAALRQLIVHAKDDAKAQEEISRYSKNYLPLLFNIYTTKATNDEEESHRRSAFDTIKFFLGISNAELMASLFDKALDKLKTVNSTVFGKEITEADKVESRFTWEALIDLLRLLIVYQDRQRIESFLGLCLPWLQGDEAKAQKKAYRVIEEIITWENESCQKLVAENFASLQKLFTESRDSAKPTSKASRMRSLNRLLLMLAEDSSEQHRVFLQQVVGEAVLGVKEIGAKARTAAYTLLVTIGQTLQKWSSISPQETLKEYVVLLLTGLRGSATEISATLAALTHILHEFAALCTEELVNSILEHVCELLKSSTREIVLASLGFVRMFVVTVHSKRLPFYVKTLVESLSAMTEESKKAYRIKTRDILERLMRKCGPEFVLKVIPKEDTVLYKRVNNMRKIQMRKKKHKEALKAAKSQDEADDAEENFVTRPKTLEEILADSDEEIDAEDDQHQQEKRQTARAWIHEDSSSIVDLLDPKAAQKVSATDPTAAEDSSRYKKLESLFKKAPDGRIIIEDSESDSESEGASDDDISEAMDDLTVGKKRKAPVSGASDRGSVRGEPAFKYQAGGSGIHRPISDGGAERSVLKMSSKMKKKMGVQEKKIQDVGAEYRSTKAQGDVKRKDKPDPFAYVPLTRQVLNKRKKAKMEGQFKGLVKAARKGASAGTKIRSKNKS
nr:EOG090X00E0 [Eulimnadia texana]